MTLRFSTTATPTADDLAVVDEGLSRFNAAEPELARVRPLAVFARHADGRVQAGAVGRTWAGCAELQQLWVDDALRGQGVGRRLMAAFEQAAAARGCRLVYLDTFSFQAPGFYAALGYAPALVTSGFSAGIEKHTMHKTLPA